MTMLDLVDMPKHVDWCFVQRRDRLLGGVNAAFREFVIASGADWARCRSRVDESNVAAGPGGGGPT